MGPQNLTFEIASSSEAEKSEVLNRLRDFNRKTLALPPKHHLPPLNYVVKKDGNIMGGINAHIYFLDTLFVEQLFVDEEYRGLGLARALLEKVEREAKAMGANLAHLDTFDFQAKDFYLKQGYEIFGTLENCPKGHTRYYLKKVL
jgi:GNAT superfamily N-acetyltransferase